ncbi:MAG: DUF1127 domain-containing protein [Acetobacteraceae bacterium]|nr:DUF1127 domain-containing protein [Acetobacteraceae bacterium]
MRAGRGVTAALRLWRRWRHALREAAELTALTDRERRDLGLTRLDIARLIAEGGRPPRS